MFYHRPIEISRALTLSPQLLPILPAGKAFESLYGGQFTLTTQLLKPNYSCRKTELHADQTSSASRSASSISSFLNHLFPPGCMINLARREREISYLQVSFISRPVVHIKIIADGDRKRAPSCAATTRSCCEDFCRYSTLNFTYDKD